jgi:hypothetical protein
MIKFLTCATALLLATIGFGAKATPILPSETSVATVDSNNPTNSVTDPSFATLQGASATVSIAPFVSLQAQVTNPPGVATQNAFSILSYYFAVVGGNPGDQVPVLAATTLFTTASAGNYGFAEFNFGNAPEVMVCTDGSCPNSQFSGTVSLTATVDQAVLVHLFIGAEFGFSSGGSVFASADPFIFVDPSFANASDYSIIVSDGVANAASATPLPAALPLFATGLGALGLLGWRRKRKAL